MADKKKSDPDIGANPKAESVPVSESPTRKSAKKPPTRSPATASGKSADPKSAGAPKSPTAPKGANPPPAVEQVVVKKGGLVPVLIGGVLAAGLGFLAARTEILDPYLPQSLKSGVNAEALAALETADVAQTAALATLRDELAAIEIPDQTPLVAHLAEIQATIAPLRADIDALTVKLTEFGNRLDPLDARLNEVEKRPITQGVSPATIAAYERELAALQQSMATQRAEVERMVNDAQTTEAAARDLEQNAISAARVAASQTQVARLRAALDDGSSYGAILADLTGAGIVVPDVLSSSASDGIVTSATLIEAFAPAARAALSAERAENTGGGGLGGFLQRQLGARSVEPRQGDDPDAILSRAEAALLAGKMAEALDEIAALPDAARAEMDSWTARASARLAALQAADALAQSLNTN